MSLPIHVDAFSGCKSHECPCQFCLDEEVHEIEAIEARRYSIGTAFFKVRTSEGNRFVPRLDEAQDQWTLQSDLDGAELFGRRRIKLVPVESATIRRAERRIVGCEQCRPDESHLPFDSILAEVLGRKGAVEFVLSEAARCPK